LSGSVARNVSGFWERYGSSHKPGALVTGDAEDEVRSGPCGLARKAVDAARGGRVAGGSALIEVPDEFEVGAYRPAQLYRAVRGLRFEIELE